MSISNAISHDKTNPTPKADLAQALGVTEREARRQIAAARRNGEWIVSLLSGGYYITDKPEEWNAFCEQERRRALATFKKTAALPAADGEQLQIC